MSSPFVDLLVGLARHRGVQGGLIVSERDGIVVDAHVQIGVRTSVFAALAASIFHYAETSVKNLKTHLRAAGIPVRL